MELTIGFTIVNAQLMTFVLIPVKYTWADSTVCALPIQQWYL